MAADKSPTRRGVEEVLKTEPVFQHAEAGPRRTRGLSGAAHVLRWSRDKLTRVLCAFDDPAVARPIDIVDGEALVVKLIQEVGDIDEIALRSGTPYRHRTSRRTMVLRQLNGVAIDAPRRDTRRDHAAAAHAIAKNNIPASYGRDAKGNWDQRGTVAMGSSEMIVDGQLKRLLLIYDGVASLPERRWVPVAEWDQIRTDLKNILINDGDILPDSPVPETLMGLLRVLVEERERARKAS